MEAGLQTAEGGRAVTQVTIRSPPNMRLKLTVRLAALARAQRGPYGRAAASAAKAPARSLSASRQAPSLVPITLGVPMRRFTTKSWVLLALFAACAPQAPSADAVCSQIAGAWSAWKTRWLAGDIAAATTAFFTVDAINVVPDGPESRGRAAIDSTLASFRATTRVLSMDQTTDEVQVAGDLAFEGNAGRLFFAHHVMGHPQVKLDFSFGGQFPGAFQQ